MDITALNIFYRSLEDRLRYLTEQRGREADLVRYKEDHTDRLLAFLTSGAFSFVDSGRVLVSDFRDRYLLYCEEHGILHLVWYGSDELASRIRRHPGLPLQIVKGATDKRADFLQGVKLKDVKLKDGPAEEAAESAGTTEAD